MMTDEKLTLLAHYLSYGLNLVEGKTMQAYNANRRRQQKDLLFETLDFDMREEGFIPDADNCFSMMTKAQVLDVIAEVKDPTTARQLSTFKKEQIAHAAERITRDTDWLPTLLRSTNDNKRDSEDIMPNFIRPNVPA